MKIKELNELEILKNNSTDYNGDLHTYQLSNGSKYQQLRLNITQDALYKRAIYGFNFYSKKELEIMHIAKKKKIKSIHWKAQKTLNLLKQEKVNEFCEIVFNSCFKNNPTSLAMKFLSTEYVKTDSRFVNTLGLEFLGVKKIEIIERFITEGILPKNFFDIKHENKIKTV